MGGEDNDLIDRLTAELLDLSSRIQCTMREVATIRHPLMDNDRVQSAVDELGAIVVATELATEQILAAAESIEGELERASGGDGKAVAIAAVTTIYEACNFQDITGQRITKVMTLLRDVDERLVAIVEHVGADRFAAEPPAPKTPSEGDDTALLNGPAKAGSGLQQHSIDSLFA